MSKRFEQGLSEIAGLISYYATNRESFREAGVKEAHIRQTLIDPFFEALGWNVRNIDGDGFQRVAPQYREVIPEDSLEIEGQQKAPDYSFRVGTQVKFFVEAKKCGVKIGSDEEAAFQLRRYGWNAKIGLSILTNFEEFSVYDCSLRPRPSDKASHGRVLHLGFDEFTGRWREIWDVFSRQAVWDGAFDHYAASKRKRGTSEVDVEFLKEIEGWRELLARNFAIRNPDISSDDLNQAVQLTIDRLVFMRMAEDRGIEPPDQLLKLSERTDIYRKFIDEICGKADDKYNSGLFHFREEEGIQEAPDRVTPSLALDDRVIKQILQSLYYGSPYFFGVMPVEILGTIYERFLGKVIRLTSGHQAKIEEKPEVRKAGGVYYTPSYIVDFIVAQTVGAKIAGKSPMQIAGNSNQAPLRVLDMACGSGSFLLGAYKLLLDHCLAWYVANNPAKHKKAVYQDPRTGHWKLSIEEKKRILTAHVFGVDIDSQAVEVTKLSLLLKALEGEDEVSLIRQRELFHERALPNLSSNIKCGNSLIGTDYFNGHLLYDPSEMGRVNAFDWSQGFPDIMRDGGFDCVIGNPPYVRQETLSEFKEYLSHRYEAFDGSADLYAYFMEKGLKLLREGGRFSYIVSSSFLRTTFGEPLRRVLKKSAAILRIVDFGGLSIFQDAKDVYVCIPLLTKAAQPERVEIAKIGAVPAGELRAEVDAKMFTIPHDRLTPEVWALRSDREDAVFTKISAIGKPLGEYVGGKMFYGIKTGLNEAFVIDDEAKRKILVQQKRGAKEDRKIYRGLTVGLNEAFIINDENRRTIIGKEKRSGKFIKPVLGGEDIRHYFIKDAGKYLIVIPSGWTREQMIAIGKEAGSERSAWSWFSQEYPRLAAHLEPFAEAARKRQDKGNYWWELRPCDYYAYLDAPKIIFPDICKDPRFFLDRNGFYLTNTAYCLGSDDPYLLAILNSRLFWFAIGNISIPFGIRAGRYRYRLIYQYMEKAPIRVIDPEDSKDRAAHKDLVRLAETMLTLKQNQTTADSASQRQAMDRKISAVEQQINDLVYKLYQLTAEEIAVVEGNGLT